jgi:hypothetical protein
MEKAEMKIAPSTPTLSIAATTWVADKSNAICRREKEVEPLLR